MRRVAGLQGATVVWVLAVTSHMPVSGEDPTILLTTVKYTTVAFLLAPVSLLLNVQLCTIHPTTRAVSPHPR